jgi:hypothetical protein
MTHKPLRNQCILLLTRGEKSKDGPSQWPVVACYGNRAGDFSKAEMQYADLRCDKALLIWRLEEGIHLCKIDADECKFTESMSPIMLPFKALPSHYRSGMHVSIYSAVADYIGRKQDD